jgi:predicted transcriptional regulator
LQNSRIIEKIRQITNEFTQKQIEVNKRQMQIEQVFLRRETTESESKEKLDEMLAEMEIINKSLKEFRDDMDNARKAATFETRLLQVELLQS